jgi:hypothetical protein
MNNNNPTPPIPLPYADSHTPVGSQGYRVPLSRLSCAGFWSPARMVDDGEVLRIEPGPILLRIFLFCAVLCLFAILEFSAMRQHSSLKWKLYPVLFLLALLALTSPLPLKGGRWIRSPWIAVDRRGESIMLPRAERLIPISEVLSLQFMIVRPHHYANNWPAMIGWRRRILALHLVFSEAGREQRLCVMLWPGRENANRFAPIFNQVTKIPVVVVYCSPNFRTCKEQPWTGIV